MSSLVPPKIAPLEQIVTASKGEKIIILCTIKRGTPPFKIEWIKDNNVLQPNENIKFKGDEEDSNLIIKSTRETDSGNYTCIAKNAFGSDTFTTQVFIRGKMKLTGTPLLIQLLPLKAPPNWIQKPSDVRVEHGSSVEVICSASGQPRPSITWKKREGSFVDCRFAFAQNVTGI